MPAMKNITGKPMKTRDDFIDDIFSKVSKRYASFYFTPSTVRITFKYDTDIVRAFEALKKEYNVIVLPGKILVVYNEEIQ